VSALAAFFVSTIALAVVRHAEYEAARIGWRAFPVKTGPVKTGGAAWGGDAAVFLSPLVLLLKASTISMPVLFLVRPPVPVRLFFVPLGFMGIGNCVKNSPQILRLHVGRR
jgi:hypothetical protein